MRLYLALQLTFFYFVEAVAAERENLMLRGYVFPTINTKIIQTDISTSKSLVTFSTQINSRWKREGQKFEVEGLDQAGMESHIKSVAGNDRTIKYELLIEHLKTSKAAEHKPIFLKISAN